MKKLLLCLSLIFVFSEKSFSLELQTKTHAPNTLEWCLSETKMSRETCMQKYGKDAAKTAEAKQADSHFLTSHVSCGLDKIANQCDWLNEIPAAMNKEYKCNAQIADRKAHKVDGKHSTNELHHIEIKSEKCLLLATETPCPEQTEARNFSNSKYKICLHTAPVSHGKKNTAKPVK